MNDWLYEDEDGDIWKLGQSSKVLIAKWVCAAIDWGGFDWDLICAELVPDSPNYRAAVDARWALAHFIHEQGIADSLVGDFEPETFWDEDLGEWEETTPEGVIAILLCWFIASIRDMSDYWGVTPTQVINDPVRFMVPSEEAA